MYTVKPSGRFKKDLKVVAKRGYDINLLKNVIKLLAAGASLPETNKDPLTGNRVRYRKCPIPRPAVDLQSRR